MKKTCKITAVCLSREKGTAKENIGCCRLIENYGLEGDAHAGSKRQVSLLSAERVSEAEKRSGLTFEPGAFGENILATGIDFKTLPIGTLLKAGNVELEITQIGKKCHQGCAIQNSTGKCIMPVEGVFAKVIKGGLISIGDEIKIIEKRNFTAAILVSSDRSYEGIREDKSTPVMKEMLSSNGFEVIDTVLVPDERHIIEEKLIKLCNEKAPDLILTSGGTGLSPRDCMPEATLAVSDKNVPGIAEAIRAYSMNITKRAMFSRAVSVMRGKTLIINLPGSPKAVRECLDFLLPELEHGILIMRGEGDA